MLTVEIYSAPVFSRLARAQATQLLDQEFWRVARKLGNRRTLVKLRHAVPTVVGPLQLQTSLAIVTVTLAKTGLSSAERGCSRLRNLSDRRGRSSRGTRRPRLGCRDIPSCLSA
jgi:hypothetical protein